MTTLDQTPAISARRAKQAERIRMALGKAGLSNKAFEKVSSQRGVRQIPRNRIATLQAGTAKQVLDDELVTVAMVCDVSLAFISGETVTLDGYEASKANPGYLNPETINRSRIDHAIGDCIGCAIDRNFHVVDEWNYHDPITGQIELILDLTGNLAEAV